MAKVTNLLKNNSNSFSVEVSPGVDLNSLCENEVKPLFYSVTWHAKTHLSKDVSIASIKLAGELAIRGHNVLLHLSCDQLRRLHLDELLETFKNINICNIFVIQGDNIDPSSTDFQQSKDLIAYIREKTSDYFCIGVAGYPDCSVDEMKHLRAKVDSGADFIITQAFFDTEIFLNFSENCHKNGITVPIIPGIFVFKNVNQLSGFAKNCKIKLSAELTASFSQSDDDVKIVGTEVISKTISELRSKANKKHFHFFSLNNVDHVFNFILGIAQCIEDV